MYQERHVSALSAIFRLYTQLGCADKLLIKLCLDFFDIVLLILHWTARNGSLKNYQLHLCSAEGKNEWLYTSTPSYRLPDMISN